jgi:acetyl esterase/lipase
VSLFLSQTNRKGAVRDPDDLRRALVERNRRETTTVPSSLARRWAVETRDLGFPAYVLTPRGGRWSRTIVHLHGGSFTAAAHVRQWQWVTRLARKVDARVVVPAYPLAPEHTWRDSHEPLVGLLQDLLAEGPVVLGGDSAGGGMALAVAQSLRDRGGPQPSHLVLLAPWVDLTGSAPGFAEAGARDPWLNIDNHDVYAAFWAGSPEDLDRREVSPGLGDLHGLPRALMLCGTHDMLYAGCVALAARAREAGWDLDFEVGDGLLHVYPILPVAEARPAFRRVVDFLRE